MTIDEFLNQSRDLKYKADAAYHKMSEKNDRAERIRSSADFGNGSSRSKANYKEIMLVDLADAIKDYKKAYKDYEEYRSQLQAGINELKWLDGQVISQVYINNIAFGRDDSLLGLDEILNTKNRGYMIAKLNSAKNHLAEVLRDQGVDIEETKDETD